MPPPSPPTENSSDQLEQPAPQNPSNMPSSETDAALLADFDRYMELSDDPTTPAALDRLIARFPNSDREVLRDVLASCEGDETSATSLLEGASPPCTDSDAALAEQLQRRENERVVQQPNPIRHRRNDTIVPLEKPVLDQMVSTLREIIVPALRAHFEELVLPDMHNTSSSMEYGLENLQVSALSLPEHNIVVKAAADSRSIRVNVINVYLELEVGRWCYESKGFVPVKDAGAARVTVHGLSVAMRLEPRWSYAGGTKIVITDCDVTIDGVVRFKTQGAAADWAYNAIIVVFKPLVVSYIKEAVANTVASTLAVHLREWAFSNGLDEETSSQDHTRSASQSPVTAAE